MGIPLKLVGRTNWSCQGICLTPNCVANVRLCGFKGIFSYHWVTWHVLIYGGKNLNLINQVRFWFFLHFQNFYNLHNVTYCAPKWLRDSYHLSLRRLYTHTFNRMQKCLLNHNKITLPLSQGQPSGDTELVRRGIPNHNRIILPMYQGQTYSTVAH